MCIMSTARGNESDSSPYDASSGEEEEVQLIRVQNSNHSTWREEQTVEMQQT